MEPTNHPFGKENHLPNHHFSGAMLIFQSGTITSLNPTGCPIHETSFSDDRNFASRRFVNTTIKRSAVMHLGVIEVNWEVTEGILCIHMSDTYIHMFQKYMHIYICFYI